MKKYLLALVVLVGLMSASVASAAPYDWILTLKDEFDMPYEFPLQGDYDDDQGRFFTMDQTNGQRLALPGRGLEVLFDGTPAIKEDFPQIADVAELDTYITSMDTFVRSKADIVHTHVASDVTNFNSAVDARISIASSTKSNWNETSTTSPAYILNKPNIPTVSAMIYGTTTRSLNAPFRIGITRSAGVSYAIDVATTLTDAGGETGTVSLEYADDMGFTTNVTPVLSVAAGSDGTLTSGLAVTQTSTLTLTGIIPAGKYVRISTADTAGTPTFTYRSQQEVLLPSN